VCCTLSGQASVMSSLFLSSKHAKPISELSTLSTRPISQWNVAGELRKPKGITRKRGIPRLVTNAVFFGVSSRRVHLMNTLCFISSDVLLSSRYDLINENMNWIQANAYCKHHYRAKLVMINSQADQLRLQAYLETLDGQPVLCCTHTHARTHAHTHTHTRLTGLCPGLPGWAGTRKVKPVWILLKQETHSGSGISWAICKSAPCPRQITTPAPHNSVFYRPANQQHQSTEDTTAGFCVVTVH